jgi:hypothetical protein
MPDREKIIKGLREMSCRATWKDIDGVRHRFQPIINDAIALLKEYKREDGCPCTHCMEWECDDVCDEYKKWANMPDGLEGE